MRGCGYRPLGDQSNEGGEARMEGCLGCRIKLFEIRILLVDRDKWVCVGGFCL